LDLSAGPAPPPARSRPWLRSGSGKGSTSPPWAGLAEQAPVAGHRRNSPGAKSAHIPAAQGMAQHGPRGGDQAASQIRCFLAPLGGRVGERARFPLAPVWCSSLIQIDRPGDRAAAAGGHQQGRSMRLRRWRIGDLGPDRLDSAQPGGSSQACLDRGPHQSIRRAVFSHPPSAVSRFGAHHWACSQVPVEFAFRAGRPQPDQASGLEHPGSSAPVVGAVGRFFTTCRRCQLHIGPEKTAMFASATPLFTSSWGQRIWVGMLARPAGTIACTARGENQPGDAASAADWMAKP